MYHEAEIGKLSENQLRKLLKGLPVRVKKGSHHKIHLSVQQLRKLHKAHNKNKASTIIFDPYQQGQHASGLFGNIARKTKELFNKHKHLLNPVIRSVKGSAHQGLHKLSKFGHEKIDTIPEFEGQGEGIASDILKGLSVGANMLGFGVKKRRTCKKGGSCKKGKGFLGDLAKAGAKALAKKGVEAGANFLTNKIEGAGRRKRRTKKQKGAALLPAGF